MRAAVILVAGVLACVLASWACAQHGIRIAGWGRSVFVVRDGIALGERQAAFGSVRLTSWPEFRRVELGGSGVPQIEWSQRRALWDASDIWDNATDDVVSEFAYGWPEPALAWEQRDVRRVGTTVDHAIWLPAWTLVGGPVPLPLRVKWAGFVADVGLFAGMIAVLWALGAWVPFGVRRFLRRRRGACLVCGYDLRATSGPTCPECGRPHEAS